MKNTTCCFTGHREISNEMKIYLNRRLEEEIDNLAARGITNFCTGGALGFDTLAALAVLRKKARNREVKLILVLPCTEQSQSWSKTNQDIYNEILKFADEVIYVSENYTRFCMQQRNRELVNRSSVCVSFLLKKTGGTAYTVNYAEKSGLEIINLV